MNKKNVFFFAFSKKSDVISTSDMFSRPWSAPHCVKYLQRMKSVSHFVEVAGEVVHFHGRQRLSPLSGDCVAHAVDLVEHAYTNARAHKRDTRAQNADHDKDA